MTDDDLAIRLRLEDQARVSRGLQDTAGDVRGVGKAAGDASGKLDRQARSADRSVKSFAGLRVGARGLSSSIGLVTRGTGGLVAIAGGVMGISTAFDEATEAAKVGAQTNAVIRSTGKAAGITAGHVGKLATVISDYAGIDDEAIQKGENLLLTFTRIRNGVGKSNRIFDRATTLATDMGVALETDTASAAKVLGRALNDPAKGYTRLLRAGVSFTDSQAEQIKTLTKNGDVLGAQKIILGEVEKKFAGSAAAQAQPLDKLKVAFGDLAEAAGGLLLPAVARLAPPVTNFVNGITRGTGAGGRFAEKASHIAGVLHDDVLPVVVRIGTEVGQHLPAAWGTTTAAIGGTVAVIAGIVRGFQQGHTGAVLLVAGIAGLTTAFLVFKAAVIATNAAILVARAGWIALNIVMNANPVGLVILGLIALGTAFVIAYNKIGWFHDGVNAVFGWLKSNWPLVLGILTGPIGLAVLQVVRHFDDIVGFVKALPGRIKSAAAGLWDGLTSGFKAAINVVIGGWNSIDPAVNVSIPSWVPHYGGKGFHSGDLLPDIPMLAAGGVVSGNGSWVTGEAGPEVNTMMNGRVHVRPMAPPSIDPASVGSGPIVVQSHLYVDGREFAVAYEELVADAGARR